MGPLRILTLVCMSLLLLEAAGRGQSGDEEDKPADALVLAMIALKGPEPLPSERVRAAIEKAAGVPAQDFEEAKGTCSAGIGDQTAMISHMPVPIPWSDLEGPCATSWMWKEATDVMKAHGSHLICVLNGGEHSKLDRCQLLTRVIAALCEGDGVAGVYWGSGTVVVSPESFVEANELAVKDGIMPVFLWMDFRVQKSDDGDVNVLTTGLVEFGRPEIEILESRHDAEDVLTLLFDLVPYLLESGDVIKEGETIGRSEEEKLPVHFVPSKWDRPGDVMRIDY